MAGGTAGAAGGMDAGHGSSGSATMGIAEIPLSRPDISRRELEVVEQVLRSGRLSIGPWQERFESMVAAAAHRRHAVAVSSGTAGLHLALRALGIGPGDEVITTPFSFVASANAILYVGATPVFVDICPRTLNMDPQLVESAITGRTKAILAVETFGNAAHMDRYESIANRHELALVEDCCEALGSSCRGRPAGNFGRAGVFAFYPNKQITTGEGGVVVTDDERVAELCRSMRSQGRPSDMDLARGMAQDSFSTGTWLNHVRLGFNYRMSELHAALGVAQMERLEEILGRRRAVAHAYISRLMRMPGLVLPTVLPETEQSWFVFVVRLPTDYGADDRDRIVAGLREHEIGAAPYFPCIHLLPFYREKFKFEPGMFPIAESVSQRTLAIPFHTRLTQREVEMVVDTLELVVGKQRMGRA